MRERDRIIPLPRARGQVEETRNLNEWEASVNRRNGTYSAALTSALDEGKTPDEARVIARQAYLDTFDATPEIEYAVSLAGTEVASVPRKGRRAA